MVETLTNLMEVQTLGRGRGEGGAGVLTSGACDEGGEGDTSILHHAFISIFIALWVVITHYVTILMPILSYFTRFT